MTFKKLAEKFDRQAARNERLDVFERKARNQRLIEVLRASPVVEKLLAERREALRPVRQAAVAALQAAPAKHAAAIQRAADARIEAERVAETAERAVIAARAVLATARQIDHGTGLALVAEIATAQRELERTADPRIMETRAWLSNLDERARTSIEMVPVVNVTDRSEPTRLESTLPQVQRVRAEIHKLIERVTAMFYEAELEAGELERLRDAGIAAMKPLELVNPLPELDLSENDLLMIPDVKAAA